MMRNRLARQGPHPQEVRFKESVSPGANLPGPELNEGLDEDAKFDSAAAANAAAAAAKAKAAPSAAASSSRDDFDFDPDGDNQQQIRTPTTTPTTTKSSSAKLPTDSGQHRQQQPRILDKAVGDDYTDWTKFDVGRSMRILRIGTEAQVVWEIRKVYLR